MANKSALRSAGRSRTVKKEEAEFRSRVTYRKIFCTKEEPRNFTILTKHNKMLETYDHNFKGENFLKTPILCPLEHTPKAKKCECCETPGRENRSNGPQFTRSAVAYVHDFEGKTFRYKDGRTGKTEPVGIIALAPGTAGAFHDFLDELQEDGVFNTAVIQLRYNKEGKMVIRRMSPEKAAKLTNKGRVPKSVREEIAEWDDDTYYGHLLNIRQGVDWEHWDVPQPEATDKPDSDSDDKSYKNDDDDSDDSDDESDKKAKRKNSAKKNVGKRRDEDDESDDEETDEDSDSDDESEDEEDEKPSKKSKSKVRTRNGKPIDEDEELDQDFDLTDDDTPDAEPDEDEEAEREARRRAKKKKAARNRD